MDRQGLTERINNPTLRDGNTKFRQIAEDYIEKDLSNADAIKPKAETTAYCYKHVIRHYLIDRWGDQVAIEI